MDERLIAVLVAFAGINMFMGVVVGTMVKRSGLGAALGGLYGPLGLIVLLMLPRD
jgi:hypothetical protein